MIVETGRRISGIFNLKTSFLVACLFIRDNTPVYHIYYQLNNKKKQIENLAVFATVEHFLVPKYFRNEQFNLFRGAKQLTYIIDFINH